MSKDKNKLYFVVKKITNVMEDGRKIISQKDYRL